MLGLSAPRRNRLLLVIGLVLIVLALLWAARSALFPYLFALALAYLMLPAVNRLEALLARRSRTASWPRTVAILAVYLLTAGLLALFFALVVPVVAQQFRVLWESRGDLIAGGQRLAESVLAWYYRAIPEDIQAQVTDALRQVGGTAVRALQTGVARTFGVVTGTVSFLIGMFVVPFWLFYVLYDQAKAMRGAVNLIPPRLRPDLLNLLRIADNIFGAYLRGQLLLCVFIGIMATLGLTLLGVPFPAVLGLIAGVFEILPFIGPFIGLVPAVIVAVIQEPLLGLWTLLLFLGIQQVENLLLVPRISGKAVALHPALIMLVLVIGNQVAGLWGMLLAVPLTAIIRDGFKYLLLRFQDEPISAKEAMIRLGRTQLQLDV